MIDLTTFIPATVAKIPRVRLRAKREFWASEAGKDPRDLYWNLTGVEPTNKTDFLGYSRMMFGSAVENQFVSEWLTKLHFQGLSVVGTQVPVGGENPNWNGYVDFLLAERNGDKYTTWPVEFKVANGFGADLLLQKMEPKEDHVYQIGLYLKCFHANGKPKDGQLLYYLNSDKNLGNLVAFSVSYDAQTENVTVYKANTSLGEERRLNIVQNLNYVFNKWNYVLDCIDKKVLPEPEFRYKKPFDIDTLKDLSDANIRSALEGNKIIGDWQISYSAYKDLHLKHDNVCATYTEEERDALIAEYKRRHPKQRSY